MLCWIVAATAGRVIDGDTFIASADIWPGLSASIHVRVLGVDTPEMKGTTLEAAQKAKAFTAEWVTKGELMLAIGCGKPSLDSFGRSLAVVSRDGKNLADELIAAGHGVKR